MYSATFGANMAEANKAITNPAGPARLDAATRASLNIPKPAISPYTVALVLGICFVLDGINL